MFVVKAVHLFRLDRTISVAYISISKFQFFVSVGNSFPPPVYPSALQSYEKECSPIVYGV